MREQSPIRKKLPGVSHAILSEVGRYIGRSGRPMVESYADPDIVEQQKALGISFKTVPIPFPDSRSEYPDSRMNLPAMVEINHQGRGFFDSLAWVNHLRFGDTPPEDVTLAQAHHLALIAKWLPIYLVLRAEAEEKVAINDIPDSAAAMHKASLGILSVTKYLLSQDLADDIITPQGVYNVANLSLGHFTDGTPLPPLLVHKDETGVRGCSASERAIVDTATTLFSGQDGIWTNSELTRFVIESEFATIAEFATVAEEFDALNTVMYRGSGVDDRQVAQERTVHRRFNELLGRDPDVMA